MGGPYVASINLRAESCPYHSCQIMSNNSCNIMLATYMHNCICYQILGAMNYMSHRVLDMELAAMKCSVQYLKDPLQMSLQIRDSLQK
jgi:hypothetical protein